MPRASDILNGIPPRLGLAIVLVGLFALWAGDMPLLRGTWWAVLDLPFGLGCGILGWHTALGLSRPDLTVGRRLILLVLLLILNNLGEGIWLVMLVARVGWACKLASMAGLLSLMGAWMVGFHLFRRGVRRLPGIGWHLPLALTLGAGALWGQLAVTTWESNLITGYFTLSAFSFYVFIDFTRRLGGGGKPAKEKKHEGTPVRHNDQESLR